MSKWLDLARKQIPINSSTNSTNLEGDGENCGNCGNCRNVDGILTVPPDAPSRGGPRLVFTSDDNTLALTAISDGCQTYGAVATTTRMGATRAFHAAKRLKEAGRIEQAKDGTLSIAEGQ